MVVEYVAAARRELRSDREDSLGPPGRHRSHHRPRHFQVDVVEAAAEIMNALIVCLSISNSHSSIAAPVPIHKRLQSDS